MSQPAPPEPRGPRNALLIVGITIFVVVGLALFFQYQGAMVPVLAPGR